MIVVMQPDISPPLSPDFHRVSMGSIGAVVSPPLVTVQQYFMYSQTVPYSHAINVRVIRKAPLVRRYSGASTVTIDNRIEQAMDLVKSHLKFAVREEVEVLREQIVDLVKKNSQLEQENNILKAGASQETLAKLNNQIRPPAPSSTS